MATDNPHSVPLAPQPGGGIATAYDNAGLLSLVGRERGTGNGEQPPVAVLIGGGPSGENWRDIVNTQGGRERVVLVTVNGCNLAINGVGQVVRRNDELLYEPRRIVHSGLIGPGESTSADYWLGLECDPPLPYWQWVMQQHTVCLMNELLMQPDWWGHNVDVGLMLQHYARGEDCMPGWISCRELVLARRNNGPHGPLPSPAEPWPPAEDDPRLIRHGLHIGPDVGVAGVPPLGTSLIPALHLCFALGVREVHSVGFDLCARDDRADNLTTEDTKNTEKTAEPEDSNGSATGGDSFDAQRQTAEPLGEAAGGQSSHASGHDPAMRQHWYEEPRYGEDPRKPAWEWREKLGLMTSEWWYQSALYAVGLRERWARFGCHWTDHSEGLLSRVQQNWGCFESHGGGLRTKYGLEHEAALWFLSRDGVREQATRIDWGMEKKGGVNSEQ